MIAVDYKHIGEYLIINAIYTLVILLTMWVAKRLAAKAVARAIKTVDDNDPDTTTKLEQRAETLGSLAKNVSNIVITVVGFITILSTWDINIAPVLTGVGIIGLAIGFGAQTLVKDLVTGFFIILENQFNVGDVVEVADTRGQVIQMNVRTTVIRSEDGELTIIPNSQISKVKTR